MKVGQKSIVRWMSKWVSKAQDPAAKALTSKRLREIDSEQLRQVSGGSGGPSTLPNKGW
jgi:hypothetical protein